MQSTGMSGQKGSMDLVNCYQSWTQCFPFLTLSLVSGFTFFKVRSLGYTMNCFHSFHNYLKLVTKCHQFYLFNPVSLHSTAISLFLVWPIASYLLPIHLGSPSTLVEQLYYSKIKWELKRSSYLTSFKTRPHDSLKCKI